MRSKCICARWLLTSVCAVSAAAGLAAQSAAPQRGAAPANPHRGAAPANPQRGGAPASPAGASTTERFTVIGCIAREGASGANARYTITDKRGDKATYRLQGDPKDLDLHTGHTVEV